MTTQEYKKGFGTLAIQKKFITKEQLIEGMETQIKENLETRIHRPIGTILKEMGYITKSQIKVILQEIGELGKIKKQKD